MTLWNKWFIFISKRRILECKGSVCQMKSTGIVRKIDELGRIVLPIELRRTMKMQIRDEVEITAEDYSEKISAEGECKLYLLLFTGRAADI